MASQWFYQTSEGRPSGPVDSTQLRRLAEAGVVRPKTLVCQCDSGRWVRAEQVQGLFQPSTLAPSSSPGTPPKPPPLPKSHALVNKASEKPVPVQVSKHDIVNSAAADSQKPQESGELWKMLIAYAAAGIIILLAVPNLGWQRVVEITGGTTVEVFISCAVLFVPWLLWALWQRQIAPRGTSSSIPSSKLHERRWSPALVGFSTIGLIACISLGLIAWFVLQNGSVQTDARLHGVHAFKIKDVQFSARQPAQFVLLEDRDVLEQIVHPPDNELHITFITVLDASRIMNGEVPLLDRCVTIQSNRKLDATAVTRGMFHEVKAGIKKQGLEDAIARNMRTIDDFIAGTGHDIDEARVIGFTETHDRYTLTGLVKQHGQRARVNTVTMRNLRGCCIVVATTALCRTQDDIDWSQTTAAECASSLN